MKLNELFEGDVINFATAKQKKIDKQKAINDELDREPVEDELGKLKGFFSKVSKKYNGPKRMIDAATTEFDQYAKQYSAAKQKGDNKALDSAYNGMEQIIKKIHAHKPPQLKSVG